MSIIMRCLKGHAAEHDLVSRLPHFFQWNPKKVHVCQELIWRGLFLQLAAKRSKYEAENDLLRIHRCSQLLFWWTHKESYSISGTFYWIYSCIFQYLLNDCRTVDGFWFQLLRARARTGHAGSPPETICYSIKKMYLTVNQYISHHFQYVLPCSSTVAAPPQPVKVKQTVDG